MLLVLFGCKLQVIRDGIPQLANTVRSSLAYWYDCGACIYSFVPVCFLPSRLSCWACRCDHGRDFCSGKWALMWEHHHHHHHHHNRHGVMLLRGYQVKQAVWHWMNPEVRCIFHLPSSISYRKVFRSNEGPHGWHSVRTKFSELWRCGR